MDLTSEDLSIPINNSLEIKTFKHKRFINASIGYISQTKSDLFDINESNNSAIYQSSLINYRTNIVPPIMIPDNKHLKNFSMTTLRFKRP